MEIQKEYLASEEEEYVHHGDLGQFGDGRWEFCGDQNGSLIDRWQGEQVYDIQWFPQDNDVYNECVYCIIKLTISVLDLKFPCALSHILRGSSSLHFFIAFLCEMIQFSLRWRARHAMFSKLKFRCHRIMSCISISQFGLDTEIKKFF